MLNTSLKINRYLLLMILFSLSLTAGTQAADINIQLGQKSINNQITISVSNHSNQVLQLAKIRLLLNQRSYWIKQPHLLQANETKNFTIQVNYPTIPGSYAQISTVFYHNDGFLFSLSDVGYFNYQSPQQPIVDAQLSSSIKDQAVILTLSAKQPELWKFIIPDEVSRNQFQLQASTQLILTGNYKGFTSNYPVFAIKETTTNKLHSATILQTIVTIKHHSNRYQRGKTATPRVSIICLSSVILFLLLITKKLTNKENRLMGLLFFSRLFFLTLAYLLLKNAPDWLSFSSPLNDHFSGNNYRYFFLYFIDIYFWAFVLLYLPYVNFFELDWSNKKLDIESIIKEDKYITVLLWLFNFFIKKPAIYFHAGPQQLQSPLKTGWLLLAVKFFFLPLLASWVIGNIIHQWNLLQNLSWTFHQINTFVLALLILTDTSIFLVGYMFENSQLGSKVRSVEPTILGWLVCLWCYPPFNTFSFAPFDINLINIHYPIASWAEPVVLIMITFLWLIFTSASFNLGFKASNLTNRGIISHGVYRYCRHPAYTAKILVWLVEAVFLGKYFIGLFIAFLIIYLLRALTEERHLSKDPDYLLYKKQVPYRFIPGVI